ncbi:unnamed protein product [Echinostoma caproni]|uniref:Peptidase_M14 domain-containing protein n=1 Tax=Echinostoma caproni TaxID=27848 RepID=A0A183ASU1_9TREM|nr:unnamed protein product [Echinostoma caproni]
MMLGLMQQLISLEPEVQELRRRCIFCLVPMLNPDGVILGNYRCSLSGRDLNRNYRHPRKEVFPTVWHVRQLVQSCKDACQAPDSFSLSSCRFSIHPSKEATGRVVFWREFNLTHSFTLEATFNGSRKMWWVSAILLIAKIE